MKNLFFATFLLTLSISLNAQISVNDSQIKDLLDPIDSQDAVSKSYLLDLINQLQAQIKYLQKNLSVMPINECIDGNAGEYECQGVDLMSSVDLDQLGATMANEADARQGELSREMSDEQADPNSGEQSRPIHIASFSQNVVSQWILNPPNSAAAFS